MRVVMCESVRLGGWMGIVMAWFLLVGGRPSRWQDRRCDGVVCFGGGLLTPLLPRCARTRRPGDILVVCQTTAESGIEDGRVRARRRQSPEEVR